MTVSKSEHQDLFDELARRGESDRFFIPNDWQAGDPCGVCGSTDTYWGLPHEGAQCRTCGAGDDDE